MRSDTLTLGMTSSDATTLCAALLLAVSTGCGGAGSPPAASAEPADVASAAARIPAGDSNLDTQAVRRLPQNVDHVMRVHLAVVRGTAFEEFVRERFPLHHVGAERDLEVDILSHTNTVTIGLGEEAVGWIFEGQLGQRFDAVAELISANGGPAATGSAPDRSLGDERMVVGEMGEDALTLHIPAAAAAGTGDIPPAVFSSEIEQLAAELPDVPTGRALLFEAWAAPVWGLFRDLKLVARVTYGAESDDMHIDAALLYPDPEIATARASDWGDFWGAFVEESPEAFDRDSTTIRSEGATLLLHHELRRVFDAPDANKRMIMWTLVSLAAHQPSMNSH